MPWIFSDFLKTFFYLFIFFGCIQFCIFMCIFSREKVHLLYKIQVLRMLNCKIVFQFCNTCKIYRIFVILYDVGEMKMFNTKRLIRLQTDVHMYLILWRVLYHLLGRSIHTHSDYGFLRGRLIEQLELYELLEL